MAFCPQCGAPSANGGAYCTQCGATLAPATAAAHAYAPLPAAAAAPMSTPPPYGAPAAAAQHTQGIAIVALILNILIWPGLGSLVAGRQVGWAQGFLFLFGIPLSIILIGIPMLIGAWIWALMTGIQLVQASSPTP